MKAQWKANLMLITAAMIWGAAFVAQAVGMDYVEPFTFLFCRTLLGAVVLVPVIFMMQKRTPKQERPAYRKKDLWICSLLCGIIMFLATGTQQVGLLYTTAGKSGFITALYVVLVPVFSLFLGKKPSLRVWLAVLLAAVALYLLCIKEDFSIGLGELLTMACALCFVFHILVIDHFSGRVDGVTMSCLQFFVCAILAGLVMFSIEIPQWSAIVQCWLPIAYAGILSCGVAYTLQILAQCNTSPTMASLLMSLESGFAVLFGWLLLGEQLAAKEFIGCLLMFAAIVLAQLPKRSPKLKV